MGLERQIYVWGLAGVLAGCSNEGPPRAQVVLYIDTDAPVVGQLAEDGGEALSSDAAIDTLRIDVLSDQGHDLDCPYVLQVVVPNLSDWPVSFGVPTYASNETRLILVRAFRGDRASPDRCGASDPPSSITISRLVKLTLPSQGVHSASIVLSSDCRGVPTWIGEMETCVESSQPDGGKDIQPDAGPDIAYDPGDTPPGPVDKTIWAAEKRCPPTMVPTASRICVPGGFTILGDDRVDFDAVSDLAKVSSSLFLPVRVSPFLMDRTEFTVGRFNDLVAAKGISAVGEPPIGRASESDPMYCGCTWLGLSDHSNDSLPLNCVSWETARNTCVLAGGRLPTQAEWEHAARGRGQGRLFPWGDDLPACCRTSWARAWTQGCPVVMGLACPGGGIEDAGSHAMDAGDCPGNGSRDGILDLAGSLSEAAIDDLALYTDPCWAASQEGVLIDPVCDAGAGAIATAHGGDWSSGDIFLTGALREQFGGRNYLQGFRCVYSEGE